MSLLLGTPQTICNGEQYTWKMQGVLPETVPFVFRNFMEGQSFSSKNKPGRFSAVGDDQKLEQTISLSSKCSDNAIGHAKQKQYMVQWD